MLRLVDNPPNPYVRAHCEYLGPPPEVRTQVYEERVRSILNENDSPDLGFRWSLNPYRGCQHACAYCFARPTHEYLGFGAGTDFDSRIVVKINAVERLRAELARPYWRSEAARPRGERERIVFSGVTDCYQPLEIVYGLTRACLEVLREHGLPVDIVTKAYLIVRDVELLAELHHAAGVHVWISIPFADDRVARAIERGAPPPARRFEAIRRLADAGVPVGVLVAPLIPGLNDREAPAVLRRAAQAGARSYGHVPLRFSGSVRPVFLQRLREAFPDRVQRVEARIREMRGGRLNDARFHDRFRGRGAYWDSVTKLLASTAARCGLDRMSKRQADDTASNEAPEAPSVGAPEDVGGGNRSSSAGGARTVGRQLQLPLC
jgi:DNA repair photolyase